MTGKVQRVGYRDFVQQAAAELSICGWVKNQSNGSVLVVAQGDPESLRALVEYLHEGSLLSEVAGVSIEWRTAELPHEDFSVLYE